VNAAVTDSGQAYTRESTTPVALSLICRMLGVPPVAGEVTGVTLNSVAVRPGDLYAALPGARTHGARFADRAVGAGAAGVMTDPVGAQMISTREVPVLVCDDPRGVLGAVSALVYDHPADSLQTFGITGTNGKTTVTYMLAAALEALG
jgi:UDP-N-acetylmuramoyl-L-alanyl-D-glutamate--2,6-diaminopimelate ligase